jgi:hypothetical protein
MEETGPSVVRGMIRFLCWKCNRNWGRPRRGLPRPALIPCPFSRQVRAVAAFGQRTAPGCRARTGLRSPSRGGCLTRPISQRSGRGPLWRLASPRQPPRPCGRQAPRRSGRPRGPPTVPVVVAPGGPPMDRRGPPWTTRGSRWTSPAAPSRLARPIPRRLQDLGLASRRRAARGPVGPCGRRRLPQRPRRAPRSAAQPGPPCPLSFPARRVPKTDLP